MRFAAVALVLLLAGCTAPVDTTEQEDALAAQIAELGGVSDSDVNRYDYSDGRQTEIVVEITTSDAEALTDLVATAAALIDEAPFEDFTRELRVTIGDSLLSVSEHGGTALDPAERTGIFSRWLADPRVSTITWVWQIELQLVGDGTTDGSLVETVYSELADSTTLDYGGLIIADPGSFTIAAAQHPYTENRFGVAREIAALDGVSECSFFLETSADGSFIHDISCSVDGSAEAKGKQINSLLDARGLLESADVSLQTPDDYIVTHEGSYIFDEG